MRKITLSQSKIALVDDADYDALMQYTWSVQRNRGVWYAQRATPRSEGHRIVLMHRQIMRAPPRVRVDHKDHDGLNNQRHNLRFATHAQNLRNQHKRKRATSRFKGVYWNTSTDCWRAQISDGTKTARGYAHRVHLGYFHTEEEAAHAYDEAARSIFGAFALLNFE